MKKNLVIIASCLSLMLVITTASVAQIKFGAIGGANFNDLTGSDVETDGMSVGYHLGGFVNIGNKLMVEPQILYTRKGSKLEKGNLNLDYIEVPIWVRYQLDGGLNFNAGPFFAVLLGAKADGKEAEDGYTTTDWGMGFGIGYQLAGGLGFAFNYNQGFGKIGEDIPDPLDGTEKEVDAKTACFKLSISYMFGGRRDGK